jgi:hypothetical protein
VLKICDKIQIDNVHRVKKSGVFLLQKVLTKLKRCTETFQSMHDLSIDIRQDVSESLAQLDKDFALAEESLTEEALKIIAHGEGILVEKANKFKKVLIDDAPKIVNMVYATGVFQGLEKFKDYPLNMIKGAENTFNSYLGIDQATENDLFGILMDFFKVECWRIRKR